MNGEKRKRQINEDVDFYVKKEKALKKQSELSAAFLRPPYQYTRSENKTINKLHREG